MLIFNDYGFLPEGIHQITWEEFKTLFGFNGKRKEMIKEGLIPFLNELKLNVIEQIYLDGSFVTRKENPGDIDGYFPTDTASQLFVFIFENRERWREEYRVDFHAALTDLEGEYSKEWREEKFSRAHKLGAGKKGYIVLNLIDGGA